MEWEDVSIPHYRYTSDDGRIIADVEFNDNGGWVWDVTIYHLVDMYRRPKNNGNGRSANADEAKQAAEQWIAENS